MKIKFRQGLVLSEIDDNGLPNYLTYNSNVGVTLRTTNRPITFSVASGVKNYSLEYTRDVLAWPIAMLTGVTNGWLWIDVNRTSAVRSYGVTQLAPVVSASAPSNPANDQHWFDLSNFTMKVYNSTALSWMTVIRVFAGRSSPAGIAPYPFGSQIGISSVNASSGTIMMDGFERAIKDSQGNFLTTEDTLIISGAPTYAAKLEANVTIAEAGEPIPSFHAVRYDTHGIAVLANYNDVGATIIGLAVEDAVHSEPLSIVFSGKIQNPQWNWTAPNLTLWVGENGTLETSDPFGSGSHLEQHSPVARTIDATTIMFDPGLGSVGGSSGPRVPLPLSIRVAKAYTAYTVEE